MALQVDTVSVPWRELRDLVLAAAPDDPLVELLRDWDGNVAADSTAASVYELLVSELACAMARDEAPNGWRWAVGGGFGRSVPRTSFGARTLSRLVDRLRSGRGTERIPTPSRSRRRPCGSTTGRIPSGGRGAASARCASSIRLESGGRSTASSTSARCRSAGTRTPRLRPGVQPLSPLANPAAIANQRTVIDLGDPERSRFVLAGGQSGNPLSPHYARSARALAAWRGRPDRLVALGRRHGARRPACPAPRLEVAVEPGEDPLEAVDPPVRAAVGLHLVVLLGVEDVLDLPAEHLERGEELLVVGRRADPVLLGLEHEQRRAHVRRVAQRRGTPERGMPSSLSGSPRPARRL